MVQTPPTVSDSCFALLDDCDASEGDRRSRLYEGHAGTLTCGHPKELPAFWAALELALSQGKHAVGLFSYELGVVMQAIAPHADAVVQGQILLFDHCRHLSSSQALEWLSQREPDAVCGHAAGILDCRSDNDPSRFDAALERIHAYIEAGDTYQVNYTCRLQFDAYGAPAILYRRLRERQPAPYGALIGLPDGGTVLSFSPELFIRHESGRLTARPMKGTAAATGDAQRDAETARALAADIKNRAENLMIVDLLRNDMGKVAVPGSVQAPHLFEVSRHGGVLQMTSTVTARLREDAAMADVFASLYPCGSITGAPKRRTMEIIRELEVSPRGLYTGAIGWFDAPGANATVGDFCLSVPIRTMTLDAPGSDGLRHGELGVGAGIVYDSVAREEYAECQLKASFLTRLPCDFELFETLHATREAGCRHLGLHLHRLQASAKRFGFPFDEHCLRETLRQACDSLSPGEHRMRLALRHDGTSTIQHAPLAPLAEPVRVMLASQSVHSEDRFLRHKTTLRARYDAAWRAAEAQGAFDMLFLNERGELTEGGRSNVFLRLDGRWYTPPLSSGLLPGVMRSVLLADPAWAAEERVLTRADLLAAESIVVCNALRGAMNARLMGLPVQASAGKSTGLP